METELNPIFTMVDKLGYDYLTFVSKVKLFSIVLAAFQVWWHFFCTQFLKYLKHFNIHILYHWLYTKKKMVMPPDLEIFHHLLFKTSLHNLNLISGKTTHKDILTKCIVPYSEFVHTRCPKLCLSKCIHTVHRKAAYIELYYPPTRSFLKSSQTVFWNTIPNNGIMLVLNNTILPQPSPT